MYNKLENTLKNQDQKQAPLPPYRWMGFLKMWTAVLKKGIKVKKKKKTIQ